MVHLLDALQSYQQQAAGENEHGQRQKMCLHASPHPNTRGVHGGTYGVTVTVTGVGQQMQRGLVNQHFYFTQGWCIMRVSQHSPGTHAAVAPPAAC
jgi:hypothetical protein